MAKFCLDPGHGGSDPGAAKGSRKEKDDVLRLALKIKPILERQGHKVLLTRSTDKDITVAQRCALANREKCDYFLSLHRNSAAASAKGVEIWVYSQAYAKTVEQAKYILDQCVKVGGTSRGVKKGAVSYTDYGVNTQTDMPSALLEMLFISNPSDNKLFDEKLDKYAEGIAKGLVEAMGEKWQEMREETNGGKPKAGLYH